MQLVRGQRLGAVAPDHAVSPRVLVGEVPRGGAEQARSNQELIFAFVESHMRGGARVELPLEDCKFRLQRDRAPRQPKFDTDD